MVERVDEENAKPTSSDRSSLEDATTNIQFLHITAKPSLELVVHDENGGVVNAADQPWTQDCLNSTMKRRRRDSNQESSIGGGIAGASQTVDAGHELSSLPAINSQ